MQLSALRLCHTIVRLHTHIFPKSLFHRGPWLHMACSHVLSALEQLGLPPPSIDSFAIMGCCGLWSCWGRTSGSDRQRGSDSGGGGMEALEERWRTGKWRRAIRCVKQGRGCQMCYALHNCPHSIGEPRRYFARPTCKILPYLATILWTLQPYSYDLPPYF